MFVLNSKHYCFLTMEVIITQKRVSKSLRVRKPYLTPKGFPLVSLFPHVTPNADCNPPQRPGTIYSVV